MIGPQRRSLLEGDVLRRQYPARAAIDRVLDRLVDAFDFQIGSTNEVSITHRLSNDKPAFPKTVGEAYAAFKDCAVSKPQALRRSWSWQPSKQSLAELINEKLCMWVLNASPDGEKQNPMELGWSTANTSNERSKLTEEDLMFHSIDEDELPLECNYTCMAC